MHIFQVTAPYNEISLYSLRSLVISAIDSRVHHVYNVEFVMGEKIACRYIGPRNGSRKLRSDVVARAELAGSVAAKGLYRHIANTMLEACNN